MGNSQPKDFDPYKFGYKPIHGRPPHDVGFLGSERDKDHLGYIVVKCWLPTPKTLVATVKLPSRQIFTILDEEKSNAEWYKVIDTQEYTKCYKYEYNPYVGKVYIGKQRIVGEYYTGLHNWGVHFSHTRNIAQKYLEYLESKVIND